MTPTNMENRNENLRKILYEWRNVKVKDHAKEVLNFLKDNL